MNYIWPVKVMCWRCTPTAQAGDHSPSRARRIKCMTSREEKRVAIDLSHLELIPSFTREERVVLARDITRLLRSWKLTKADQLRLLGMDPRNHRALNRFASGHPLSAAPDILARACNLLCIRDCVDAFHPNDRRAKASWMTSKLPALLNRSPFDVINDGGFIALLQLRARLESEIVDKSNHRPTSTSCRTRESTHLRGRGQRGYSEVEWRSLQPA